MKQIFIFFLFFFGGLLNAFAQTDILGFDETIAGNLQQSFPASTMLSQAISQLPVAIGNGGNATVSYIDENGVYQSPANGGAANGSVTASANINLGNGVSTTITWTATITWITVAGPDGMAHIRLSVTWGSSSESYSRQIDIKTAFPNAAVTGTVPTVYTGAGSPRAPTVNGGGHWETHYTYGYIWYYTSAGHLGAYWGLIGVSVWVPAQPGPGDQNST